MFAVALGVAVAEPGLAGACDETARVVSIRATGVGPAGPADNTPADPTVGPLPADRLARFAVLASLPGHRLSPVWAEPDGERPGYSSPPEHPPRIAG